MTNIAQKITALLIYGRPPLIFGGLVCAIAVMWGRNLVLYETGVFLLLISMSFDIVDGWFATRYPPNPTLANLADRIMDKIVYSTIFPLVAVGMMWRLIFVAPDHSRAEMLHAIFVLLLCITVLIRDNFAHFIRSSAVQKGVEPETREFTRLRTTIAAPVGALLYIHAFYLPSTDTSIIYQVISWINDIPLRTYFIIEIVFFIINFGSIAALCRKYGALCLDDVCHEDDFLRRRILSLFPNALTLLNAIMGVLAVLFAYHGYMRQAYVFLIGAAIFDKLDGALARKLGLTEPLMNQKAVPSVSLGSILDDIADAVSFCFAPALIFYITLAHSPIIDVKAYLIATAAFFYLFMGVGRLIYFTMDRKPIPGFFKGMPTPAAAIFVVAPLLLYSQAVADCPQTAHFWGIVSFVVLFVASLAMNIYPVHYMHLGRFMDRNPLFRYSNISLLLVALLTPLLGYITLSYLLFYLVSPVITRRYEQNGGGISKNIS